MNKIVNSVWFKCITVLLVLSCVLGGTLAILNDVLYVSPEERTERAIKKIYGQEKTYSIVLDVDLGDDAVTYSFGKVNKVYNVKSESGKDDMLFQTTGYEGYKGGTITLWVLVKAEGSRLIIDKVVLESYDKQTLMSKLGGNYYDTFLTDVTDAYKNGGKFTTESGKGEFSNPISGATYSANAGNNAVNCVIEYLGGIQ